MMRLQALILAELDRAKALKKIRGLTITEITQRLPSSDARVTVYKSVTALLDEGLVAEGVKAGRARSFYMTDEGIKAFERIKNEK